MQLSSGDGEDSWFCLKLKKTFILSQKKNTMIIENWSHGHDLKYISLSLYIYIYIYSKTIAIY